MSFWASLTINALERAFAVLDALGARGARWEWKKRTWRLALEARVAAWENLGRGARTRMRMCPACRALVEGGGRLCPSCGASIHGVTRGGPARFLRLVLPGIGSLSMILVSAIVSMSLLTTALGIARGASGAGQLLSPSWQVLYLLGAKSTPAIDAGQIWRLVTAGYLHGGLLHLLFNCYALMSLGPLVEGSFGARKLFVIYSACGVGGFAASARFSPAALSVGASAALFGLIAFAVVFGRFRGGRAGRLLSEQLMRWLLFGVAMSFIPGIDIAGHLGGAACGGVLGLLVDPEAPRTPAGSAAWWLLTAVALAATIGSFAAMAWSYPSNLEALVA